MTLKDQQIKKVVDKIVDELKPEKVIVFGSHAWGQPNEDSDLDLLIVKQTKQTWLERQRELNMLLVPRTMPMDFLVYTSAELEEKINQERNLFLEDALRNGKEVYSRPGSRAIHLDVARPLAIVP